MEFNPSLRAPILVRLPVLELLTLFKNYFVKSVFKAGVPVYRMLMASAFKVQLSLNFYSKGASNFSKAIP